MPILLPKILLCKSTWIDFSANNLEYVWLKWQVKEINFELVVSFSQKYSLDLGWETGACETKRLNFFT